MEVNGGLTSTKHILRWRSESKWNLLPSKKLRHARFCALGFSNVASWLMQRTIYKNSTSICYPKHHEPRNKRALRALKRGYHLHQREQNSARLERESQNRFTTSVSPSHTCRALLATHNFGEKYRYNTSNSSPLFLSRQGFHQQAGGLKVSLEECPPRPISSGLTLEFRARDFFHIHLQKGTGNEERCTAAVVCTVEPYTSSSLETVSIEKPAVRRRVFGIWGQPQRDEAIRNCSSLPHIVKIGTCIPCARLHLTGSPTKS